MRYIVVGERNKPPLNSIKILTQHSYLPAVSVSQLVVTEYIAQFSVDTYIYLGSRSHLHNLRVKCSSIQLARKTMFYPLPSFSTLVLFAA